VASLSIEERLLHYFIAMGAQRIDPIQSPGLTLNLGSDKVHVAILKNDALLQRGKIIESVMNLSSLRDSMNQLYLAAPRLLGSTIDAEVFRSHGIGLLLFDERRIDETVEPQSIQRPQPERSAEKLDAAIVSEVEMLRSMYLEMERTVSKLRADLKGFQENFNYPPSAPQRISQPPIFHQEPKFAGGSGELPSFFSNNPWLDVLSRRGREEATPIAG
jgi:hypothetical protein